MATVKFQPELATHLAAGTITGEQILSVQLIDAVGCLNPHRHMAILLGDIDNLVLEAQINQIGEISATFDQILLNIILLQIDKGGEFVAILRQQIEAVDFLITAIDPAHLPGHPLGQHPVGNAKPVKDFQSAFCPADCAASHRNDIVVIENDAGHASGGKVDRCSKTNRPRANDDHRRISAGRA